MVSYMNNVQWVILAGLPDGIEKELEYLNN